MDLEKEDIEFAVQLAVDIAMLVITAIAVKRREVIRKRRKRKSLTARIAVTSRNSG